MILSFFLFNDTAATQIYTLSLHDALPISGIRGRGLLRRDHPDRDRWTVVGHSDGGDRKSTRLNSSHTVISYAVFCLKKKSHPTGTARAWRLTCCRGCVVIRASRLVSGP